MSTTNGHKPAPRVRVVGYTVSIACVVDDGDTLTPVQGPPVNVTVADWPNVQASCAQIVAAMQAQLDQQQPLAPNRAARRSAPKAKAT